MITLRNLMELKEQLEGELEKYSRVKIEPTKGCLVVRKSENGKYKYSKAFTADDGSRKEVYISPENISEAKAMANSMWVSAKKRDLRKSLKIVNHLITMLQNNTSADLLLQRRPGLYPLLDKIQEPMKESLKHWKDNAYPRSYKRPEDLRVNTIVPGLYVRSKSERDIISRLEWYGVPYHYEEIIDINGKEIAMDFVCRNVETGEMFYWDHRGMMDNPEYCRMALNREHILASAGIVEGINMIVTTETKEHPLDIQWVDVLIKYYLI